MLTLPFDLVPCNGKTHEILSKSVARVPFARDVSDMEELDQAI